MVLDTQRRLGRPMGAAGLHRAWLLGGVAAGCLIAAPALAQTASKNDANAVEELVVTGTSIRGEQPVGSSLVTLGREDIMAAGAPSTADLLTKVPQLTAFNNIPRITTSNAGANTPPGLRGLPASATLVLLDGHRMVGGAPLNSVPDPSSIPTGAIQRVEVVADGASAIYGSDAVAGVINIITRRNLDGAETSMRVGQAEHGYNQIEFSQAFGKTWSGGSALATVAYSEHDNLIAGKTDFYTNDLRPFGGTDLRATNCFPANIRIGTTTYVPPNYVVGTTDQQRCDYGGLAGLTTENRRTSFVGNLNQAVTDKLSLSGLLEYAATYDENRSAPGTTTLTIPRINPFFIQPPGTTAASETALYSLLGLTGGANVNRFYSKHILLAADATYALPHDWQTVGSFSYGSSQNLARNPGFDATLLASAAAGTTTATALDPFGNRTNPTVAAAILNFETRFYSEQKIYDYQLRADGPLFTLPGGDVKLAVGLNYRKTEYHAINPIGAVGSDPGLAVVSPERTLKSAFAEIFVPLVSEANAMPLVQELNLSVAGRIDDYSDVGSTTNPKFGITWRPVADLMIRGSYGKSFHAPDLADLFAVDTRVIYSASSGTVPPGSSPGPSLTIAGGNPRLSPETATTYSFGAEYNPSWLEGFRGSLTYYDINYQNQIRTPPLNATIFSNAAFAAFYYLNPTPAQVEAITAGMRVINAGRPIPFVQQILDLRRQNLAATHTAGIDFSASYRFTTDLGAWVASIDGNKINKFETQGGVGTPFVPDITVAQWRVRGNVSWRRGPLRADATYNHLGSFYNSYGTPAGFTAVQEVKPFQTVDLGASYQLPDWGWIRGTTLGVKVDNLFNADPPMQIFASGISAQANPLGRFIWLSLQKTW